MDFGERRKRIKESREEGIIKKIWRTIYEVSVAELKFQLPGVFFLRCSLAEARFQ